MLFNQGIQGNIVRVITTTSALLGAPSIAGAQAAEPTSPVALTATDATVAATPDATTAMTPDAATAETTDTANDQNEAGTITPKTRGWMFGVGAGLGSVGGTAARGGDSMYDLAGPMGAASLAFGYRFGQYMLFGRLLAGLGSPESEGDLEGCGEEGIECRSAVVRYSLQARAYLLPGNTYEPWVGVGFGGDRFALNVSVDGDDVFSVGASGTELLNLTAGVDFWQQDDRNVSVFADYGLGRYDTIDVDGEKLSVGSDDQTFHHWVMLGCTFGYML